MVSTEAVNVKVNTGTTATNGNGANIRGAGEADYAISEVLTVTEVPEPSSLALIGIGGLLVARRRRG